MLKLCIVIAIGCCLYRFLSYTDVYILVRGNNEFNASIIKLIKHTDTVYKIMGNAYDGYHNNNNNNEVNNNSNSNINTNNPQLWNYAILATKFVDEKSTKEYLSILKHLNFVVELNEVTKLVPNYEFIMNGYNFFQFVWTHAGGSLGFLPSRPLFHANSRLQSAPAVVTSHTANCKNASADSSEEEVHTVSLFKVQDEEAMQLYENFFLWKIFPALQLRLGYNGKPESSEWSQFVVLEYKRRSDFCELISSDLFGEHAVHRRNGMSQSISYLAKPL